MTYTGVVLPLFYSGVVRNSVQVPCTDVLLYVIYLLIIYSSVNANDYTGTNMVPVQAFKKCATLFRVSLVLKSQLHSLFHRNNLNIGKILETEAGYNAIILFTGAVLYPLLSLFLCFPILIVPLVNSFIASSSFL